jgi:uncharacterized protein
MFRRRPHFGVLACILSLAVAISAWAADSSGLHQVPKLSGWVSDTAKVLTEADRERLTKMLSDYHEETHHQIVLLTIATLGGERIEAFSLRTATAWGLGYKNIDNGILVALSMKERKMRIELGKGMERFISDSDAKAILDTDMTPAFSKGDFYGGLRKGLLHLMDEGRRFVVPAGSITSQSPKARVGDPRPGDGL